MPNNLYFHFKNISTFPLPDNIREWINGVIIYEKLILSEINIIFCNDRYLLSLNKKHLAHNFYTDIITFDYSTDPKEIYGDLFISQERIIENASSFNVSIDNELLRIIVHGLLHLFGYSDKSKKSKKLMQSMEDFYLSLYSKKYVSRET